MRRSDCPTEKQAELENEAHGKPEAKESLSDQNDSNVVALDNGTMVEVFKYMNYCQLAKSRLVSKRYGDLIQNHRHMFARLYVHSIHMREHTDNGYDPSGIKIFNQELSLEGYNEWVIRNGYSKQIPLQGQVAKKESTQNEPRIYELHADAIYENSYCTDSVLSVSAELNHENWPLFQHFARLLTDPFIYIRWVGLNSQIYVLNLLTGAINSDPNRLQCNVLEINLGDNMTKFMSWIKDHVRCDKFRIFGDTNSNYDEEFLVFFLTGANCTSKINVRYYDLCKVIIDFVQKFMDLKS